MRKQYYFRMSPRGLLAWEVHRLAELSKNFPRFRVPIAQLRELDEPWAGADERPTWRALLEHMRLVRDADLSHPILLSAGGEVMDGRHRIVKAALEDRTEIMAVQFTEDPEPDYVGRGPEDLPY
jgi:hypothetical protein